jgi:hypothetical protein
MTASVLVLSGCTDHHTVINADFKLLELNATQESIQPDAENAQEYSGRKQKSLIEDGLICTIGESELKLSLMSANASLKINPIAIGLPESWRPFHELEIELQNESEHPIKTTIVLWAPRGRLPDTLFIQPSSTVAIRMNLHDLPLIGSVNEKYSVNEIEFQFENQDKARVIVKKISLLGIDEPKDFVVMDKFGQRKSTEWPGKVKNESEFQFHSKKEIASLQNQFNSDKYDRFLGYKTRKTYPSNGYFSLSSEVINGQRTWFFITPEGNPFWSFGVTCIRPKKPRNAMTLIKGHEQLFEVLPEKNGPFSSVFVDSTLSFYNLNLLKKYGNLQAWREMSFSRLKSWGLNTIGNWAEDTLIYQSTLPFTWSFETNLNRFKKDVYDPAWSSYVDSVFSVAASFKNNKYLLGYFVDNEGGWGDLNLIPTLPENACLRLAWKEKLVQKYQSIEAYNEKNETFYSSWEVLVNERLQENVPDAEVIMLESLFTERYFHTVSATLRKYDPNHLYLGCRFTRQLKPEHILQIAGKYCDVVTVNVYSYEPVKKEMDAWHRLTGKPILIGEHQAALNSARQLPLRWQTFTEEERYVYFTNYVKTWAQMPYALGSHWYQYADQHITGRASNGENQIIGFVDITDQPYEKMIEAARYNATNIYEWHGLTAE